MVATYFVLLLCGIALRTLDVVVVAVHLLQVSSIVLFLHVGSHRGGMNTRSLVCANGPSDRMYVWEVLEQR